MPHELQKYGNTLINSIIIISRISIILFFQAPRGDGSCHWKIDTLKYDHLGLALVFHRFQGDFWYWYRYQHKFQYQNRYDSITRYWYWYWYCSNHGICICIELHPNMRISMKVYTSIGIPPHPGIGGTLLDSLSHTFFVATPLKLQR